jgi:YHS domain-containing protein
MTLNRKVCVALACVAWPTWALAQDHGAPGHKEDHQPPATAQASKEKRVGDPYPLDVCPVTGKKLGSMGDPVVKLYDGREVRFCCPACPKKFEEDRAASIRALDEKIVKDQAALYPLKTSVVSGKELPEKPVDLVYGNRLVRLASDAEKAEFNKDPKRYLAELDKAVIATQGKHYPLTRCPVSKEQYGGDMGQPKDVVLAGRLIRLCCNNCKKELESDPANYIAVVDQARKGAPGGEGAGHEKHGDHPDHDKK